MIAALLACGAAAALLYVRRRTLVITVKGVSMRPTLYGGDVLIGRRVPARRLRAGQIVVVEKPDPGADWQSWSWPERSRHLMIKRLAALPGQPVPAAARERLGAGIVPPGVAVVLGDNLAESVDSREIGYFPLDRVVAVALRTVRRQGEHPDP
ncbi:S26 family signal peptidase [Streptomyces sp. NPDC093591]|uniref:S26 family signal peptidase n=1 Tax=Streptomyces sp. NPDC093591 TaxID=3366044 RepID=UPI0038099093